MHRPQPPSPSELILRVFLSLCISLFVGICVYQITLPGLYYDEALDQIAMLELLRGQKPALLRDIGLGGWPLMLLDYMGSLGGYATVPFLATLGPGVLSSRLQPIVFSALSIALAALVARRWFGPHVAACTALLMALDPSFIWFTRQGISVTSIMSVFAWGSLLAMTDGGSINTGAESARFLAQKSSRWWLAGALLGLGLWAKLPFLWWLMMLAAMAGLYCVPHCLLRRIPPWRMFDHRRSLALTMGFVIGAAPLLYYNLVGWIRDGVPHTAGLVLASLLKPTQQFGVNNLDFAKNLGVSWSNFKVFVDGSYFWYNGVTYSNIYALPALGLALLTGGLLVWTRPSLRPFRWRWLACAAALPVAIFMGSFTVSGQWATHFFIISGLPQVLLACAAVWLATTLSASAAQLPERDSASAPQRARDSQARRTRLSRAVSAQWHGIISAGLSLALLALPLYQSAWVSWQHHATLARTGGSGRFSDAVYKVAHYLDQQRIAHPIALDWGIEKQVRVLTADRVQPIEVFGYAADPDDAFRARIRDLLQEKDRTYVVLWDQFAVYNRRHEFTRLANQMGRDVREVFIAHERSGLPVYVVLKAQ